MLVALAPLAAIGGLARKSPGMTDKQRITHRHRYVEIGSKRSAVLELLEIFADQPVKLLRLLLSKTGLMYQNIL